MSKIEEPMLWAEIYKLSNTDVALTGILQIAMARHRDGNPMTDEEILLQMVIAQTKRIQEADKALKSNFSEYLKPFQYKGAR